MGTGPSKLRKTLPQADAFAVAAVGEAVALREAGVEQKILVLGGFIREAELVLCIRHKLDPVIHHQRHFDLLEYSKDLGNIDIWVKIDSGMGRLGFALDVVPDLLKQLSSLQTLGKIRLMSHLASADDVECEFSIQQIEAVKSLGLDNYEWGLANSAGILGWPGSHNTWVRAGIALYGANPMSNRNEINFDLKPVMTMKTRVLAVNPHKKGDVIGYANLYCCPENMMIAVIATGYADGYPRHKIDTAQVKIRDQLCDIVGRVSMDMITVDVSHLDQVDVDDEVVLFGDLPDANNVADCAQTIAYEVLCNVGAHVRREYINKA